MLERRNYLETDVRKCYVAVPLTLVCWKGGKVTFPITHRGEAERRKKHLSDAKIESERWKGYII